LIEFVNPAWMPSPTHYSLSLLPKKQKDSLLS
jgi:hypothetical protein